MGFDLSNYEDVASLNRWFQENYPMGRIAMDVVSDDPKEERMVVMVSIYRDANDSWPAIQNIARGKQSEYNKNMARFYAEDVATSAIGRTILLLKGAEKTAHLEGMKRAEEMQSFEKRLAEKITVEKPSDPWTTETKDMPIPVEQAVTQLNEGIKPEEIPTCQKHEIPMQRREGNKNGRAWMHYKCVGKFADPCDQIIWYEIDKTGRWTPQKPRPTQGVIS